jgi:hypothetical protein
LDEEILVPTHENACRICSSYQKCSQGLNRVTCSLAIKAAPNEKKAHYARLYWSVLQSHTDNDCLTSTSPPPEDGPGTELHNFMSEKGYEIEPGCNCLAIIRQMNIGGVEWCKRSISSHIIPAIVAEAHRRQVKVLGISPPEIVLQITAERWVRSAIRRYESRIEGRNELRSTV